MSSRFRRLHFLAVLGIDEDTHRLREGNDFSFMLAGIVYCCPVLGVEIILPKKFRRGMTAEDDEHFLELRPKHLSGDDQLLGIQPTLCAQSRERQRNILVAGREHNCIQRAEDPAREVQNGCRRCGDRGRDNSMARGLSQIDAARFKLPVNALEDDIAYRRRGYSFLITRATGSRIHGRGCWIGWKRTSRAGSFSGKNAGNAVRHATIRDG